MIKRMCKTISLIAFSILLHAFTLFAGISVEPTVTEKILDPGAVEEGKYILINTGQKTLDVAIELEDWMGRLFGIKDELSVQDWLTVEPGQVTLEPGQKVELKYTVKAPADFTRERVAQVFFSFSENVNLRSRLGVIFYLSPKQEAKLQAEIVQMTAESDWPPDQKEPQLTLWFEIKNESNVHIRPRGSVGILDETGNILKELVIANVPGIYPGKNFTWTYRSELKDVPRGFFKAKLALDYGYLYGQTAVMEKTAEFHWNKVRKVPEQKT